MSEMINRTVYYPMYKRQDGAVGIGGGYETRQEAIEELLWRQDSLINSDLRFWVKIVRTDYEEIAQAALSAARGSNGND